MVCKNCGANFQTADLKCPYCGTENSIGYEWQEERNRYENLYENISKNVKENGPMYVATNIINRAVKILLIISVALTILCLIPSVGESLGMGMKHMIGGVSVKNQLKEYHETGQWHELLMLVEEYSLFGKDNYVYSQAAIMQRNYEEYMLNKLEFLELSEEEKIEDDYCLERSIKASMDVYFVKCGIYSELEDENVKQHEKYKQEIEIYWRAMLGMTEEEVSYLTENKYLSSDEMDEMINKIKERKAWQ